MNQNSGEIIQSDCSFDNKILLTGLRVRHQNFGDIDTSRQCNFKRQTFKTLHCYEKLRVIQMNKYAKI